MTDSTALLAQLTTSFLIEAYGTKEQAIEALTAELEQGDLSSVRAGVIASQEKVQYMGTQMILKPELATKAVYNTITQPHV